jgi:putative ABC transport system permease protein
VFAIGSFSPPRLIRHQLLPALLAPRSGVMGLQHASVRVMSRHQTPRRLLVVIEGGLAVVLLIGAGLLLSSVRRLLSIPPGFEPARSSQCRCRPLEGARAAGGRGSIFGDALEAVRALPGVEAAGFTAAALPAATICLAYRESGAAGQTDADRGAFRYAITPGYLEAMGSPFVEAVRGRARHRRRANAVPSANRSREADSAERRDWAASADRPDRCAAAAIVGIVGNVRQRSLGESLSDAVYVPNRQWILTADRAMWLVV